MTQGTINANYERLASVNSNVLAAESSLKVALNQAEGAIKQAVKDAETQIKLAIRDAEASLTQRYVSLSLQLTSDTRSVKVNATRAVAEAASATNALISADTQRILDALRQDTSNVTNVVAGVGCEALRLLNTPDGQRASSIPACSTQPAWPYTWNGVALPSVP